MTSQSKKKTIAIHILIYQEVRVWGSEIWSVNKTFFLKNHTQNMVEKLFPDPWAYLWINTLKFYTVCFYCMPSWGLSKYIETKLQTTYFYLVWWILKKQRALELVSLVQEKYFS